MRSQDVLTAGDPQSFDGTVLRLDPVTGGPMPDNPLVGGATTADDAIVAYGLRNPFRMTARPGTNEMWLGDVGWNDWEEIDRIGHTASAAYARLRAAEALAAAGEDAEAAAQRSQAEAFYRTVGAIRFIGRDEIARHGEGDNLRASADA